MTTPSTTPSNANPLDLLPMRRGQIWVLVIAMLLSALDGYDVLSMALVAPAVGRDWHIAKDALGLLLSSALVGMGLGSVALSPLGDIVGRKRVVLGALVLMTLGAALSAAAQTVPVLAGARILTGFGIGAMIAMTTILSAEFANVRRRPLAVAAVATLGTPLGSIIGGVAASRILKVATWHEVFVGGAGAGIVLFVLVMLALPESPAFLLARRKHDALERANRVMAQLGQPGLTDLPPLVQRERAPYRVLFAPGTRAVVLRLSAVGMLVASASYFALSWMPQMVVDAGYTPAQGSMVSAVSGVVSLIGGVSLAALASRFPISKLSAAAMAGAALSLVAVALVPPSLPALVVAAAALGLCLAGTAGTFYAITASTFPPAIRATGVGFVIGALRIGSTIGPALAGVLFAHGMARAGVSLVFAAAPLAAALLVATLRQPSSAPDPA